MNADSWKQIDDLFDAALDLPESERESFLSERCKDNLDLKAEVMSLLAAAENSEDFLERSAIRVAAENMADEQSARIESELIGRNIGAYRIESVIGSGGMGDVYLAFDNKLHRRIALKILPSEYTKDDERVKRFRLEARAISALNHPNIVTVYDVGTFEGVNFIATEFVEGNTLRELIGKPRIGLKDVLAIIIQTCEALSAAHDNGIIHRDIKPENIIVRPDGYVKVLDFGLAKLSEIGMHATDDFAETAKGVIIGTPAYMSPEQIADDKVDHRTDLWSVAVVLYELLTGVNPFKKDGRQSTFQAILSEGAPPASQLNKEVTPELDRILAKALEKDADISYQTASDLRADLRRVVREIDSSASLSRSDRLAGSAIDRFGSRRRLLKIGSALLIPVLAAVALWFLAIGPALTSRTAAVDWKRPQNLQITESPGIENYSTISPDGKTVVFANAADGDRNIYRQRVGGRNATNLTPNSPAEDSMPMFSADGKLIAFRSEREESGIYVMEETGENLRRVSDLGFHPAWSPDGRKLVVSDSAASLHTVHTLPNSSLLIIDLASGDKRKIDTGGDAIMPSWSPNGNRIAFWSVSDGKLPHIATVPADGGQRVTVADGEFSNWNPVWSPDGKFIYFASDRGGNMNLWRVPVDERTGLQSGEPESIMTPSRYPRHISISRDGRTIAYVRYESQSNIQSLAFDPKTLKAGSEVTWVTRGDKEISSPALSPRGDEFVARQPSRSQEDLVIFDRNGQNWRNLMNDQFRERAPIWSPDGSRVVFQSNRTGRFQIWSIRPDGSDPKPLTFTTGNGATEPVFSPDGKRLAYTESEAGLETSKIIDLSIPWPAQKPQQLPPHPEKRSYSVRDWSKNGDRLLYVVFEPDGDERGIGVFDLRTNSFENLTERGSSPTWLNDGRHFIYLDQNTLRLFDTETKKITDLYKPAAYNLQQPDLSADNTLIYFRYLQIEADVWLIEATPENP